LILVTIQTSATQLNVYSNRYVQNYSLQIEEKEGRERGEGGGGRGGGGGGGGGGTGWSDPLGKLPRHFGPPLDRGAGTAPPQ